MAYGKVWTLVNIGIIYYTNNGLRTNEGLFEAVMDQISKSGLPITSCSLSPMSFGKNVVHEGESGVVSYFTQIYKALEASDNDYVFFCEHDVFYHLSHFDFRPDRDDVFYYNTNVWRWYFYSSDVSTYDNLMSVSGICCNRKLALGFYKRRLDIIFDKGYDKIWSYGNPLWARKMGYEPGKENRWEKEKAVRVEWKSEYPNIDVRHTRNITPAKMMIEDFRQKPVNWTTGVLDDIPGWDADYLRSLRQDEDKNP